MEINKSESSLLLMLCDKINYGQDLVKQLQQVERIDGVPKLQRKIMQEIKFLKKLQKSKKIKIEQLSCSNLRHLGALVSCAIQPGTTAVCKIFHVSDDTKMVIDIICNNGKTWKKVIARNPKSLTALSSGNASFGARSILDQAEDYLECAKLYPCMFQRPQVVFEFVSGIEKTLAQKLKATSIVVQGDILPDSHPVDVCSSVDSNSSSDEEDEENDVSKSLNTSPQDVSDSIEKHADITTLNLDVTAMMAYVSNMTNGHCSYIFKQDVLTQQCKWEAERPVKPILEKLFQGKSLVCCKTAWDDFEKIVNILGGSLEKERAKQLQELIKVFPDYYGGADEYPRSNLKVRGHEQLRSKTVFNFGHRIKAVTVSANEGFVRAAYQQGVTYAAFIHESRALTEGKEPTAIEILLSYQ